MHEEVSQRFFFPPTNHLLVAFLISWTHLNWKNYIQVFPTTMPLRDNYEKCSTGRQAIK